MIKILLAMCLAVALQASATAQDERSIAIQKLYEFTQDVLSDKLTPVRGGTKAKALGCYLGSKDDIQYRSGYKDVEPRTQCEWAYDLNQFIVASGGGKNNSRAYSSAMVPPKDWWLHDAVVDGNNLWTRYEQINGKASSDHVMWRDAGLAKLLKKQ
jgi:hypothetical protein